MFLEDEFFWGLVRWQMCPTWYITLGSICLPSFSFIFAMNLNLLLLVYSRIGCCGLGWILISDYFNQLFLLVKVSSSLMISFQLPFSCVLELVYAVYDWAFASEELITEEVSSESKRTSVFCSVDSCWEQELQLIAKHSYGIDIDLSFAYQSELSISSDQSPKHPWGAGSLAHCNRYP